MSSWWTNIDPERFELLNKIDFSFIMCLCSGVNNI